MFCVIFDLDGTLIDSEPLCSQAFIDLLPGLDDTVESLMCRYRGHRMADVLEDLSRRLGYPLGEEFNDRYRTHLSTLYDTRLAPMPGVSEVLRRLDRPMCVASNGPVAKMHQGLKVSGLDGFFGPNVFSAYDVGRWKPEPHLFLHAASRMGFEPGRCVVLEDSDAGVAAGRAAGMHVIRFQPESHGGHSPAAGSSIRHFRELEEALQRVADEISR